MSISEKDLRDDLKTAMRDRDTLRSTVIRNLLAAAKNKAIEAKSKGAELSDSDMLAVVKREAKQCAETLEFARKAGRAEAVAEHEAVLGVIEGYLPAQMAEDELREAVRAIVAETGAAQIGPIMKELASRHAGRYDGKLASRVAGEILAPDAR